TGSTSGGCGTVTVTSGDSATNGTSSCNNVITRTYTATDSNGSTANCTQTITVNDTTAPSIGALPPPSTIECPASPSFTTPSASDGCDRTPTLTFADSTTNGTCANDYSVTRTWTATDACHNSSTASQTITVEDTHAPDISALPPPRTIERPATPSFTTPSASDACDSSPTLTFADSTTTGTCANDYSATQTYTSEDASH